MFQLVFTIHSHFIHKKKQKKNGHQREICPPPSRFCSSILSNITPSDLTSRADTRTTIRWAQRHGNLLTNSPALNAQTTPVGMLRNTRCQHRKCGRLSEWSQIVAGKEKPCFDMFIFFAFAFAILYLHLTKMSTISRKKNRKKVSSLSSLDPDMTLFVKQSRGGEKKKKTHRWHSA